MSYTPGDGARTLKWVIGMVDTQGLRCVLVDESGALLIDPLEYWEWSTDEVPHTPDLTDRATFLLAIDELDRRYVFDITIDFGFGPITQRLAWYRTIDVWYGPLVDELASHDGPPVDRAVVVRVVDRALYDSRGRTGRLLEATP